MKIKKVHILEFVSIWLHVIELSSQMVRDGRNLSTYYSKFST